MSIIDADLSFTPESGHLDGVDNLEDPLAAVHPVDVVPVLVRHQQQLLQISITLTKSQEC